MEMLIKRDVEQLLQEEFPIDKIVNAGYRSYLPDWKCRRAGYTCTVYYVISGGVNFEIDEKKYSCGENDIFHLSKGEIARIENASKTEKCELYFITFELRPGNLLSDLQIERPLKDETKQLYSLFRRVCKTHLGEAYGYKLKEFYEFTQLIYEMMAHSVKTDKGGESYLKIDKAVQHVKMNYYKCITVEELAEISGYSVSHFRKIFVKTCGMSPQEYVLKYKIEKAKEMLAEESEKSVEEIADFLKFCNASYFCKVFKKREGCSPYKYKSMMGVNQRKEIT